MNDINSIQIEELDSKDKKILMELQRNGRISLVELGSRVGLKHSSVKARIKKLIERGIIKIQANFNIENIGYNICTINVEVEDLALVYKRLLDISNCPKVLILTTKNGEFNISILMLYKNFKEVNGFIEKRIRKLRGIRRISIESNILIKPKYLPYDISSIEKCTFECSTCNLQKELPLCSKCSLISLVTKD